MAQIFISHSTTDSDFAKKLYDRLAAAGFQVWMPLRDLKSSTRWDEIVQQEVEQAEVIMVIVSATLAKSKTVSAEINHALKHGKPIVPIRISDVSPPLSLSTIAYLDFEDNENWWKELLLELRRILASSGTKALNQTNNMAARHADFVELARQKGVITYDEILNLYPDGKTDITKLDDLMDELMEAGVEVAPSIESSEASSVFRSEASTEQRKRPRKKREPREQYVADAAKQVPDEELMQPTGEQPTTPPAPLPLSIGAWLRAGNDRATGEEDQLEFHHYVNAFADLIESTETKPPLTIGIFGSWGAGKSFLLNSLKRELKAPNETRSKNRDAKRIVTKVQIVEFNAWEYNATEVIWAGLVRKIMDNLEKEVRLGWSGRLWKRFRHNFGRQWQQSRGRFFGQILLIFLLTSALVGFVSWVNGGRFDNVGELLVPIVGLSGLIAVVNAVRDALVSPVSQWVTALFEEGNYGRQIEYMADIRSDLEFLEKRLRAENERVLIIIDDLDRCEPNKAVEVLQAINLLLNFDSFIVLLGIDARIITGAISKYYSNLLENAGASGYEYLDKIIQIPFRIPLPNEREIRDFIDKQMGSPKPLEKVAPNGGMARNVAQSSTANINTVRAPQAEPVAQPERNSASANAAFGYDELRAFQQFSRFLRPNPRHLKRLVNVYLLVRTLANYRGAWAVVDYPVRTARWLIMSAQWSYTSMAMLRCYDELCEQHGRAAVIAAANGSDPLLWLLGKAIPLLDKAKCSHLDDDLDQLRELLRTNEGRMDWDTLDVIRRYTINFNPAVEAEAFEADGLRLEVDSAPSLVLPFE